MGWAQTVVGEVECVVCRARVVAEADLLAPVTDYDAPWQLGVGDSLAPFAVSDYDHSMVRLRPRAEPEVGRAIAEWTCPVCAAQRWAFIELAEVAGEPRVVDLRACPMALASIDQADWIHGEILVNLVRPAAFPATTHADGRLDERQRELVEAALASLATTTEPR